MSSKSYLTQINPDLQALGNEADLLYYGAEDVKVSSIEFNNRVGRYIRSLTTLSFGGSSDISIPNYDLLGSTYLQVRMPALPATVALPDNWLHHCIESINYSWGTSNISLVKISGQDMLHHNYMSCETKEKREKMTNLAGSMKPAGVSQVETTAAIVLKFPWSIMGCDKKKKLFDTRLLDTNMLIQITWASKEKIFGYLDANLADVPTALASAEIILKQNELSDHSDSIYTEMRKDPSLIYNYPFNHLQTGSNHRFNSVVGTELVDFEMQGFLNSDLIGILFSVCSTKDVTRTGGVRSFINPFKLQKVENIKLEYNGQILSYYPANLSELATLNISQGDTTCDLHQLDPATGAEVGGDLELSYVYYVPFTQYKNISFGDEYNNTSVYKSQPLDLSFTFESDQVDTMIVRTTYIYNAYCSIQDMASRIHFG